MTANARVSARVGERARAILNAWKSETAFYSIPFEDRDPAVLTRIRDVTPISPTVEPCNCGAPRWEHGGEHSTGKATSTGCARYAVDKVEERAWQVATADSSLAVRDFKWWDRKHADADPKVDGQLSVRPSDSGGCPRAVWYRNFPPTDYTPAPTDERAATLGSIIHKGVYDARAERYPWREHEVQVTIPGLDRRGRLDEYDPLTFVLDEGKTAGARKWDMLNDEGPTDSMWAQGFIYGLALTRTGRTVETIRVRVIHRDKGWEETYDRPYDDVTARGYLRALTTLAGRLDDYRTAVEEGDPNAADLIPERAGDGPRSFPCSWCPARLHCWNVDAAEAARRSPESYTVLGADPEDDAIAATLADYAEAREIESTGKKRKEVAKALLDGIENGDYGDWSYTVKSSEKYDAYKYATVLEELFDLPEEMRPHLEGIKKNTRVEERVYVTKKRAAGRAKKAAVAARAAAENTTDPTETAPPADVATGTEGAA